MDGHVPRRPCGNNVARFLPPYLFNAFSLVQAPMGSGHMACLASNDARKFHDLDILEFFVPCCIAMTEWQVGTPDLFVPTHVLGDRAVCRMV
jgi:hypothetical protein